MSAQKRLPTYVMIAERIKAEWISRPDVRPGDKLPTQHQLRKMLGASRPTVAKALALLAAEGLVESRQGSGVYLRSTPLESTRTRLLSFIAPQSHAALVLRAYYGIERRARQKGYSLLMASSENDVRHEEELVEQHLQAGAQGVILYPVTRWRHQLQNDYLRRRWRDVPIVLFDIGYEEWERPMVLFDNFRLGYQMTQALLAHGHRHIAFLPLHPDCLHRSIRERREGWLAAMQDAGVAVPPSYLQWAPLAREQPLDGEEVAHQVLRLVPVPDALITWEDSVAVAVIRALQKLGVAVPEEMRVVGFDDLETTHFFQPAFPTSQPDFARLGEIAVEVLDEWLSGRRAMPRTYILSVPVLWREPRTLRRIHPKEGGSEDEA
ncbi:MAG: substrate-binding domain-containing protein [Armatimonadota bacterium]|nr:substrate-binding domain-containing protein [bacterium]MCS7310749.1 substrate-binding domain-containing protein [Armatimonadota bacterium]MDW8104989.1 substrate-binding domain-containing protein [Armatimonadota bacterium]MDW8290751.1 substrate-binding domain-containing protein [Armatimonadota bacterium]